MDKMLDLGFRAQQHADRYLPNVRAINQFVDRLRNGRDGSVPYVAPSQGGSAGGILSLMLHPGSGGVGGARSGFLSLENDDDASRQQLADLRSAEIEPFAVTPWNASPWYSNDDPSEESLRRGAASIAMIISLMPAVRVVLIQGVEPLRVWDEYVIPLYAHTFGGTSRFEVIPTYSSGWGALGNCTPEESRKRKLDRRRAYSYAREVLHAPTKPWVPPRKAG